MMAKIPKETESSCSSAEGGGARRKEATSVCTVKDFRCFYCGRIGHLMCDCQSRDRDNHQPHRRLLLWILVLI